MTQGSHQRLIRRLMALTIGAYGAWFGYTRIAYRPEPRVAYWEAKLRELNPERPGMIPFEDALSVYRNSETWFDSMRTGQVDNVLRGAWTPETRGDIAHAVSLFRSLEFQIVRDEHLAAIRRGWVTPPLCRARLTTPTTWMVRRWSIVLLAQSRFMFSEHDDAGGRSMVWGEILALANLLESSRRESEIRIAAAMRCNLAQEIARAIGETPACTHIPPMDGLLATGADLAASPSSLLAGAILDERSEFDRIFVRDGTWLDVSEASALYLCPKFAGSRVWNLISPIFYTRDEANAALDTLVSRLDRCETAAQVREEFSRHPDDLRSAAPLMCRGANYHYYQADLVRTLESAYLGRTANEAAACLIALHNYRADFGEYPVDLKTLVPDFLARPPIDFAIRRPLRYERRGEGFVLYSVGADGVDNHGRVAKEREYCESPWGPDGVDYVFSNVVREPIRQ